MIEGKRVLLIDPDLEDIVLTPDEIGAFCGDRVLHAMLQRLAKLHREIQGRVCRDDPAPISPDDRTFYAGMLRGIGMAADALEGVTRTNVGREANDETEAAEKILRKQLGVEQ